MNEQETETALAKREANTTGGELAALIPQTLEEMFHLADVLIKSKMAPKGATREGLVIRIAHGLEIGLKPMQAVQGICEINGHPSIFGDAGIGLVQGSNLLERHEESWTGKPFDDDFTAHCLVKRRGVKEHTLSYSVADAKLAKLWKKAGPWTEHPKRMLMWRARLAFRDQFADVLKGLRFAEEVRDIPVVTDAEWQPVEGDTATGEGTLAAMKEAVAEEPATEEAISREEAAGRSVPRGDQGARGEPETVAPPILGSGVPEAEEPPEAGGSPID